MTPNATVWSSSTVRARRCGKLPDCVVAVLGVGSIGTASLSLLLARAEVDVGAPCKRQRAQAGGLGRIGMHPHLVHRQARQRADQARIGRVDARTAIRLRGVKRAVCGPAQQIQGGTVLGKQRHQMLDRALPACDALEILGIEQHVQPQPVIERLKPEGLVHPMASLKRLAVWTRQRVRPKSGLGRACDYLLNQWESLVQHLRFGQTRLDNNLVENAIRPSCIGKKNWLFIGHPDAGQRSAILYSLIVSCQRHGKDPLAFLKDLLTRLPRMTNQDDLRPLLPVNWQPPAS